MRERQRERNGNGEARRAGDRVVGPTKLPGSTTDTFLDSNHQDTMTTRSLASSPTRRPSTVGLITVLFLVTVAQICSGAYYGKLIGKLSELQHGVSGEVYAVDARTLFIKDFTYDGEGPAAFFYAGNSKGPGNNGFRVRDERGTTNLLKRYRKKDITLTLPDGKTLNNIKWFSVWCDEFSVNFGDVRIPRGFDYPKPQKLKALSGIHGVSSEPIVIVDAQTLLIPRFSYDGEAPAKFWVGAGSTPSSQGIRVPDENGKEQPLRRYDRKTIVLTLPADLTVHQLGHFGVWCEAFAVDFGHVQIPHSLNIPPSLKMLGVSPQNVHRGGQGQSEALTSAYEISSFASSSPSPLAIFPSFASSLSQQHQRPTTYRPLLRRDDQVQVVQAVDPLIPTQAEDLRQAQSPAYASVADVAGYQEQFYRTADVASPTSSQYHPQPSPRSRTRLAEPQQNSYARLLHFQGDRRIDSFSKLNCEVLEDSLAFEVRWAVAGDSIVIQLVAKLDDGQYMSFGLSADTEKSMMVPGDVTVAWVDKQTLQGYAIDYFLNAKSQCSGRRGSCPDRRIQENTDSVRLLNAAMVNGYSIVTYQRPLKASDELDLPILTNGSQAIIWAIGPLNDRQEVSFHSHYLKTDRFIEFGRPPAWNCPMPDQELSYGDANETASNNQLATRRPQHVVATPAPASTNDAWEIPPIQCYEPEDGIFYAQMGPTGGKHGYPAITATSHLYSEPVSASLSPGHVGWGISWYINGLLIPVINVVRGRRYTFVVEGGSDPDAPARYHPFYITDDPIGGYYHKTAEEKAKVKIFAGVRRQRGKIIPTGVGRLCNWVPDQNQPPADEFASFGAYQRTLTLECDHGEPGFVEWTPDENTPDTVYYQCFTHRYLGWKINVLDNCDVSEASPAASEKREVFTEPDQGHQDLEYGASISVPSKTLQQAANMITTGALSLPFPFSFGSSSSPRPILIERKKSVYRPPVAIATLKTTPRTMADKASLSEKLTAKIDTKQRTKFETKIGSDSDITENHLGPSWKLLKPARNTGFNPDSIVIESGFKPIIRNVFDKAPDVTQKRMWQDGPLRKNGDYRTIDEFSPVFVPSLPVTSSTIDGGRKRKKKTSSTRSPPRFDDLDDMEMAADLRLDTYYLPPIGRTRPEELPSPSSSGVLITYDGKKLSDSTGLARSISDSEHHAKGQLTSDILSRTPQFGKFQGELPPLIPGEMRANDSIPLSYGKKNRLAAVDLPPRQQLPKTSTRLKLVERSKRSPLDVGRTMSSVDFQHEHRERDRIETINGGTRLGNLGWVVLIAIARLAI
ncbi:SKEL1 protein, partial [Acromyrmex charruanus]